MCNFASGESEVRRVAVNIQRCRWVFNWEKPSSVECTLLLELTPTTQALCASHIRCARGSLLPTHPRVLPKHPWWHYRWSERHSYAYSLHMVPIHIHCCRWVFFRMTRRTMNENCGLLFMLITHFNGLMFLRTSTDLYLFTCCYNVYESVKQINNKE